ncbi:hypothetical protein [Yoonia sp. BS5-3]|uniref:Uncharacterized protein n=1 Tax=Yoonia phaeophyticola TaxID=3137369 RepID=A0ABZ2V2I0_9RHOB
MRQISKPKIATPMCLLCIVDDCAGEALATVVDRSLSDARITRERDELIRRRGQPDMMVSELPMDAPRVREPLATGRK